MLVFPQTCPKAGSQHRLTVLTGESSSSFPTQAGQTQTKEGKALLYNPRQDSKAALHGMGQPKRGRMIQGDGRVWAVVPRALMLLLCRATCLLRCALGVG